MRPTRGGTFFSFHHAGDCQHFSCSSSSSNKNKNVVVKKCYTLFIICVTCLSVNCCQVIAQLPAVAGVALFGVFGSLAKFEWTSFAINKHISFQLHLFSNVFIICQCILKIMLLLLLLLPATA